MPSVRKLRILLEYKNSLRKVCKIFFSLQDASLYLTPYSFANEYYYGETKIPEGEEKLTFEVTEGLHSQSIPKLSIHYSGQIHVQGDGGLAGPIHISPLNRLSGQHIATVLADLFEAFPIHHNTLKSQGSEIDLVVNTEGVESGRLIFYVNAYKDEFPINCMVRVKLERPQLLKPLFVGIAILGQPRLSPESNKIGTNTIIAGWNPIEIDTADESFLYIRGI
jgi:hypothetical protein